MNTPSLFSELSELLDDSADATETARPLPPFGVIAQSHIGVALASVQGQVSAPTVVPSDGAQVEPQIQARKAARDALTDDALAAAAEALGAIRKTFAENNADFDDACKALPLVHRILEQSDRQEAATKETKAAPVLMFTIVLDDSAQLAPTGRQRRAAVLPLADVIDIDPNE